MASEAAKERIRETYPDIIRASDVAELLGMNVRTVLNMAHDGRVAAHRLPGTKPLLFYREDILTLLDQSAVSSEVDEQEEEPVND